MEQPQEREVDKMSQYLLGASSIEKKDRIILPPRGKRRTRLLAMLLICLGLIPAAFAVLGVWMHQGGEEWLRGFGSFLGEETSADQGTSAPCEDTPTTAPATPNVPEELPVPEGAIPIRDMDLSALHLGAAYFHNETLLSPNIPALEELDVGSDVGKEPLVLILHTHASEGYRVGQNRYFEGVIGDLTYSENAEENVLSAGKALCDTLNQNGIGAIHCTVMHDADGYGNAYAAALKSVRFYLTHYPSIRYVIDVHRDAVTDTEGNYVRSLASIEGEDCAQVMAVVGSPDGGEACPNWEGNLALALQLRTKLNADGTKLCRPVSLRNHTYNQEIAPYSLLLEIGTGANTPKEAQRAAVLVGEALAELIRGQ